MRFNSKQDAKAYKLFKKDGKIGIIPIGSQEEFTPVELTFYKNS